VVYSFTTFSVVFLNRQVIKEGRDRRQRAGLGPEFRTLPTKRLDKQTGKVKNTANFPVKFASACIGCGCTVYDFNPAVTTSRQENPRK
jgi:hypothetical protein